MPGFWPRAGQIICSVSEARNDGKRALERCGYWRALPGRGRGLLSGRFCIAGGRCEAVWGFAARPVEARKRLVWPADDSRPVRPRAARAIRPARTGDGWPRMNHRRPVDDGRAVWPDTARSVDPGRAGCARLMRRGNRAYKQGREDQYGSAHVLVLLPPGFSPPAAPARGLAGPFYLAYLAQLRAGVDIVQADFDLDFRHV